MRKGLSHEKTILVGVINSRQNIEQVKEYLDELEFLTFTAGGKVQKRFVQKIDPPNTKTFIGSGKITEVMNYVKANDISSIIFDDELTPAQQGNIEKILKIKVLDRTGLILDIFAQRHRLVTSKSSRASSISISSSQTQRTLDTSRETKRRYRDERSRRN